MLDTLFEFELFFTLFIDSTCECVIVEVVDRAKNLKKVFVIFFFFFFKCVFKGKQEADGN